MANKPPFSMMNDQKNATGLSVALWEKAASMSHISSTYIPTKKSYDKAVMRVYKGKCTVLVGPISVTNKRLKLVDFTRPYFINKIGIAVKSKLSFWGVFRSFFEKKVILVFGAILFLMFFFSFLFWLTERKYNERMPASFRAGLARSSWFIFRAFFVDIPKSHSTQSRLVLTFWILISVMMLTLFTSIVTSSLTVSLYHKNDHIAKISDLDNLKFSVEKDSTIFHIVNANGGIPVAVTNFKQGLTLLNSGAVSGFIGAYYMLQNKIREHKEIQNIQLSPIILRNDELAFVVKKGNNDLVNRLDLAITYLQDHGLSRYICHRFLSNKNLYDCEL